MDLEIGLVFPERTGTTELFSVAKSLCLPRFTLNTQSGITSLESRTLVFVHINNIARMIPHT